MTFLLALFALGLPVGLILLSRVPLCPANGAASKIIASVIIPARNEEHNLPRLLDSLWQSSVTPHEVIVVDDSSQDATAAVAAAGGATVLAARPLPAGWTGKTWACFQGAEIASGDVLVFLDADTWFSPQGFGRLLSAYAAQRSDLFAVSLLPFHDLRASYEELSLFFNLLMAFGAGGFGLLGGGLLFGQSLVISRALYDKSGGHAAVRRQILENVALADRIEAVGGKCACLGARGVLNVRMFPDGFKQLWESWVKAFADGAAASDGRILALSISWLSALSGIFLVLLFASGPMRWAAASLYACSAIEVWWLVRQIGRFSLFTCALYPVALLFFFALFAQSLVRRTFKRQVTWRGRRL